MRFRHDLLEVIAETPWIKTVIIDQDGTLLKHGKPLFGADEILKTLVQDGKEVVILSNNTSTAARNTKMLAAGSHMFKDQHYHHLLSTGDVMQQHFAAPAYNGKRFLVLGEVPDASIFPATLHYDRTKDQHDFAVKILKNQYDYIYLGVPWIHGKETQDISNFTFAAKAIAAKNLPIFAGYEDKGVPEGGRSTVLQGDVLEAIRIEAAKLGHTPSITTFGKPKTESFAKAIKAAIPSYSPYETLMVGDNPATDVKFGKALGMQTVYVASSPHRPMPRASYIIPAVGTKEPKREHIPFTSLIILQVGQDVATPLLHL